MFFFSGHKRQPITVNIGSTIKTGPSTRPGISTPNTTNKAMELQDLLATKPDMKAKPEVQQLTNTTNMLIRSIKIQMTTCF